MIRNKFRMRFKLQSMSEELVKIFNDDHDIGRAYFKLNRTEIICNCYYLILQFLTDSPRSIDIEIMNLYIPFKMPSGQERAFQKEKGFRGGVRASLGFIGQLQD